MSATLLRRRHWIFDMDGTLTLAMHDFSAFKATHGLPADRPILEHLQTLPVSQAAAIHTALRTWEADLAGQARAAPGAQPLLQHLARTGCRLAVLTRNTQAVATLTLRAAGLDGFFAQRDVLGRDSAPAKPDPGGILKILRQWGAAAEDAVMVGDYVFDVQAGRAAGTATVLVDRRDRTPLRGAPDGARADRVVCGLDELLG